jgi:HlyD family secretion protein
VKFPWTILALAAALLAGQTAMAAGDAKDSDKGPAAKQQAEKQAAKKPAAKEKDAAKPGPKKPSAKQVAAKEAAKEKPSAKDSEQAAESKPATYRLKKGPFRVEVTLEGVFQAEKTAEVFVRPQEWAGLTALKAVEHGAVVHRGDLLLALDPEKIDRAISELRADMKINDLALKEAEEQTRALEKAGPLDLEAANRAGRIAQEDWKQYLDVIKPLSAKIADYNLKAAQEMLEYQEEEYRQLKKMYRADELTEETEKIVLKRTEDAVQRARVNLEIAKAVHEEARKLVLPRTEEKARDATRRAEIEVARAKITLPVALTLQQLKLEKLKVERTKSEERLEKLLADREAMTVKAPLDGVVYYGRFVRGKWQAGLAADPFRRGAPVTPNDVLMTVVELRPLAVRATATEAQVQYLHTGLAGIAVPGGFPNMKLSAVVQSVSAVPTSGTSFDVHFTLGTEGLSEAIVPAMTCEVRLIAYKKSDALTVPTKAVFADEFDLRQQFVYLVGKDGKPQKRPVTVGQHNDKQTEILAGLAAGDQILLEKPKDKDD